MGKSKDCIDVYTEVISHFEVVLQSCQQVELIALTRKPVYTVTRVIPIWKRHGLRVSSY